MDVGTGTEPSGNGPLRVAPRPSLAQKPTVIAVARLEAVLDVVVIAGTQQVAPHLAGPIVGVQ